MKHVWAFDDRNTNSSEKDIATTTVANDKKHKSGRMDDTNVLTLPITLNDTIQSKSSNHWSIVLCDVDSVLFCFVPIAFTAVVIFAVFRYVI